MQQIVSGDRRIERTDLDLRIARAITTTTRSGAPSTGADSSPRATWANSTRIDSFFISDRKVDMVISGGVNVYPAEIEAALATMPGVADSAVFGIPDAEFGESLCAVVQPSPGQQLDARAVQQHLRRRIAGYKVPRTVLFADDLPREDSWKISKRKLRQPFRESAGRNI